MLKSSLLALALILPTLAFAQESDPSVPEVWNASILYLRDYAAEMSQLAPLVSQALEAPAPDCGPDVPEKDCAPHLTQAALPGTPLANAADGLPQVPAKIAEDAVRAAEAANKLTKMEPPTTMDEVKRILKETLGLSQETYRHLLPNLAEPLTYGAIATIGTIPFNESVGNHAAQHPWPSYIVKPAEIAGYGIPIAGTFAAAIFTHNAWARRFTEEALAFNLYAQSFSEGGKLLIHCNRPDGSNRYGCPSGHAIEFFGLATIAAKGQPRWVKVLMFLAAAGATSTRVGGAKHYLYQVTFGATFGTIFGRAVNDAFDARGYGPGPTPHHGFAKLLGTQIPLGADRALSYQLTTAAGAGAPRDAIGVGAVFSIGNRR